MAKTAKISKSAKAKAAREKDEAKKAERKRIRDSKKNNR